MALFEKIKLCVYLLEEEEGNVLGNTKVVSGGCLPLRSGINNGPGLNYKLAVAARPMQPPCFRRRWDKF
ncbi:MAG: hypothetical protein ACPMAG_05945 [Limisphaerales bacterium]